MSEKRSSNLKRKVKDLHTTSSVEVVVQDVRSHPVCFHGPTLLFSQGNNEYYACSQYRDKKLCSIHITTKDWSKENVKKLNRKYLEMIPKINKVQLWMNFIHIKSLQPSNRAFCVTCEMLLSKDSLKMHSQHNIISPITDEQLVCPSTWLPPLNNNAAEAQYFFTAKSINVIVNMLRKNKIFNVLCIGTPSIHETLCADTEFSTILLDCDKRHAMFHPPNKFLHYNMFNNHFFADPGDPCILRKFLSNACGAAGIVMDPPFGGRVEPLINTLKCLTEVYRSCAVNYSGNLMSVIWAFPYFSEPYICNMESDIKMHDFQVEYENHNKFQNTTSKGRKFGSPVRLFTNLPLGSIDLSMDPNYKYCSKCGTYVALTNRHCAKCGQCTSKNGMTYQHCFICSRCVKPTYTHCKKCARCCPKVHECGLVLTTQSCYNCKEKGHKKSACPYLEQSPDNSRPQKMKSKLL